MDYGRIFGDSAAQSQTVDWDHVEKAIGTALPDDYKAFAESYPALYFDSFLILLHPCSDSVHGNFLERGSGMLGQWQIIGAMEGVGLPYSIFPSPGGLLPWGYDDDNGQYFWKTTGSPSEWLIVITESLEWWEYEGGFGAFWSDLAAGRISSPVLPQGFPSEGYQVERFNDLTS